MSTSKVMTNRESSAPAAFRVRSLSAVTLRDEFLRRAGDDTSGNTDGRHYDMRTLTSNGERFYPFVFSKTLAHDPLTGLALDSDVNVMIKAVTEATPATMDALSAAQSANTTRGLVSVSAGLSFTLEAGDPKLVGCTPPTETRPLVVLADCAADKASMVAGVASVTALIITLTSESRASPVNGSWASVLLNTKG